MEYVPFLSGWDSEVFNININCESCGPFCLRIRFTISTGHVVLSVAPISGHCRLHGPLDFGRALCAGMC